MIEIKAKKNKVKENLYDVLVHWDKADTDAAIINILTSATVDMVDKMVAREKDVMIPRKEYFETFARMYQMLADKEQ